MVATHSQSRVFDCLVLSGGGSKGAYSAGVAKALSNFFANRNSTSQQERCWCFVGTSVGAFNSCVLASSTPDLLIAIWRSLSNDTIKGKGTNSAITRLIKQLFGRRPSKDRPFARYPEATENLRALIKGNITFEALKDKHVILPATNFTTGRLKAYYISGLVDTFKDYENNETEERKRWTYCESIKSQQDMEDSLLASSAIPFFFPPVRIDSQWYIDGGVGNNTPTREAAYFLRYLEETGQGQAGNVYCVKLDPPTSSLPRDFDGSVPAIIKRTLDVNHYVYMEPIIRNWNRINDELDAMEKRIIAFTSWMDRQANIPRPDAEVIVRKVREEVCRLGGVAERKKLPLITIEPSGSLGDTLDFEPKKIEDNILLGYRDTLKALRDRGQLSDTPYTNLLGMFP